MTDIWVPLPTFRRLIKEGHHNGPVFESKETVLTSVGAITVLANKRNAAKEFCRENGYDFNSSPFKRRGYMVIATTEEKVADEEEATQIFIEELEGLSSESLIRIKEAVDDLLKGA